MPGAGAQPNMTMSTGFHAQGRSKNRQRSASLAAGAVCLLLLGLLVYLTDRPAFSGVLIPRVDALADRQVFGVLGQWLPSLVHPFAFSLLTVAALPAHVAPRYGVCAAWGAVNVGFEAGQHPAMQGPLAALLHDTFGTTLPVHWIADYFRFGTFDSGDVLAAVLGALAAAGVLFLVRPRLEKSHAQ